MISWIWIGTGALWLIITELLYFIFMRDEKNMDDFMNTKMTSIIFGLIITTILILGGAGVRAAIKEFGGNAILNFIAWVILIIVVIIAYVSINYAIGEAIIRRRKRMARRVKK